MFKSPAQRIFAGLMASSLYLACTPSPTPTGTQNSNQLVQNSGTTLDNTFSPGSKGFDATNPDLRSSIFRALGGVGLDPAVAKFCSNESFTGDQGYARAVARTYRGYLNKLLSQTSGGSAGPSGSVYNVDPITGLPIIPQPDGGGGGGGGMPFPTALPSAQDDISIVERTSFNGKVFNNANMPVDGATITARSLNDSVPFEAETTTAGGTFAFNNAPAGVQIEIVLSQPGFAPRRRVEVLKSNKQGDPNANRYDFGNDGSTGGNFGVGFNAASDKPEVIRLSPGRNTVVDTNNPPIVITFSEPMDKASVESNIALCINTSIQDSSNAEIVYTADDFNISWNSDESEVTLILKPGKTLNPDEDYHVGFKAGDRQIKDKSGVARGEGHFKLTDGNHEDNVRFSTVNQFQTQNFRVQQANFQPLPPPTRVRDDFYFSYDDSASTASVELFKHAMDNNRLPRAEWSKTWEFLNYEKFDHVGQESIGQFQASMGLWKYNHLQNPHLEKYEVGIHLTAPFQCKADRSNLQLTVLLDISSSMLEDASLVTREGGPLPTKIELAKQGLKNMAAQLKPGDVVNLLLFSNDTTSVLNRFRVGVNDEETYLKAIEEIQPAGGTNLQKALQKAYAVAQEQFDTEKTNRILFITDAKATEGNVDMGLVRAASGTDNGRPIYLSGLGMGIDHDTSRMDRITDEGKGSYYSINTRTDMKEAMGDRFIPLMNVIARNVRFNLEFPGFMRHNRSASEELSRNAAEVQTTNFSANTSQYFWEEFLSNKGEFKGDQTVVLTISYDDPITGQPREEKLQKTLAEILDKDLQNIKAAHLVNLTTSLVRKEVSATEVRESLEQLLPDVGR